MVGYILDLCWSWTCDIRGCMVMETAQINEEKEAIDPIFS